jgi:hypothetical protein
MSTSVPFISPALLARALLVQQVLNLARAVPSFVYEIYPQMVGVFLCLIALSLGKHGLRTLSQRSLALFCLLVVVSTCVDVALWISTLWAIRHGRDDAVKASFWYAILEFPPSILSTRQFISKHVDPFFRHIFSIFSFLTKLQGLHCHPSHPSHGQHCQHT